MGKLIYATKGWKSLQKDYISKDFRTSHLQKLHTFLQQDISGCSFEEAIIHYGFISHAAMQICIADYMQAGTFENSENYFYLSSRAKAASDKLWIANPHKAPQQGQEIQQDIIMAAVLCGCTKAAIDMLEKTRMTVEQEPAQLSRSRKDIQKSDQRKKRILLEINFYESLLQNNDDQARKLLLELEKVHHDDLFLRVIRTFLEHDNEQFSEALLLHMKEFRSLPYAEAVNCFVLLMEALYLKRGRFDPLNFADAPALLLRLPECDLMQIEEKIGITLPTFETDKLLKVIDHNKIGPKFKQY